MFHNLSSISHLQGKTWRLLRSPGAQALRVFPVNFRFALHFRLLLFAFSYFCLRFHFSFAFFFNVRFLFLMGVFFF